MPDDRFRRVTFRALWRALAAVTRTAGQWRESPANDATLAAAARRVTFETPPANRARLPSYASSAVSMRRADVIHIPDRLKPYR